MWFFKVDLDEIKGDNLYLRNAKNSSTIFLVVFMYV